MRPGLSVGGNVDIYPLQKSHDRAISCYADFISRYSGVNNIVLHARRKRRAGIRRRHSDCLNERMSGQAWVIFSRRSFSWQSTGNTTHVRRPKFDFAFTSSRPRISTFKPRAVEACCGRAPCTVVSARAGGMPGSTHLIHRIDQLVSFVLHF